MAQNRLVGAVRRHRDGRHRRQFDCRLDCAVQQTDAHGDQLFHCQSVDCRRNGVGAQCDLQLCVHGELPLAIWCHLLQDIVVRGHAERVGVRIHADGDFD